MRVAIPRLLTLALVAGCGNSNMPATQPDMTPSSGADLAMSQVGDLAMLQVPCNLIKQDCTDPVNTKCAAVDDGAGNLTPMCVLPTGDNATDAVCTRIDQMSSGEGYDNCAKGNYCSGVGTLSNPPVRHCRSFCLLDSDCKNSERCVGLISNAQGSAYVMGLCIPTCTPFGTDCGQGLDCASGDEAVDLSTQYFSCRETGQVAIGGACSSDLDCVADSLCASQMGKTLCAALCDMGAHPCTDGKTCTAVQQGSAVMICL